MEYLPDQVITEASDFVAHCDDHVFLCGDMSLICRHFEHVSLVQVDFLIVCSLAQEKLCLL